MEILGHSNDFSILKLSTELLMEPEETVDLSKLFGLKNLCRGNSQIDQLRHHTGILLMLLLFFLFTSQTFLFKLIFKHSLGTPTRQDRLTFSTVLILSDKISCFSNYTKKKKNAARSSGQDRFPSGQRHCFTQCYHCFLALFLTSYFLYCILGTDCTLRNKAKNNFNEKFFSNDRIK